MSKLRNLSLLFVLAAPVLAQTIDAEAQGDAVQRCGEEVSKALVSKLAAAKVLPADAPVPTLAIWIESSGDAAKQAAARFQEALFAALPGVRCVPAEGERAKLLERCWKKDGFERVLYEEGQKTLGATFKDERGLLRFRCEFVATPDENLIELRLGVTHLDLQTLTETWAGSDSRFHVRESLWVQCDELLRGAEVDKVEGLLAATRRERDKLSARAQKMLAEREQQLAAQKGEVEQRNAERAKLAAATGARRDDDARKIEDAARASAEAAEQARFTRLLLWIGGGVVLVLFLGAFFMRGARRRREGRQSTADAAARREASREASRDASATSVRDLGNQMDLDRRQREKTSSVVSVCAGMLRDVLGQAPAQGRSALESLCADIERTATRSRQLPDGALLARARADTGKATVLADELVAHSRASAEIAAELEVQARAFAATVRGGSVPPEMAATMRSLAQRLEDRFQKRQHVLDQVERGI